MIALICPLLVLESTRRMSRMAFAAIIALICPLCGTGLLALDLFAMTITAEASLILLLMMDRKNKTREQPLVNLFHNLSFNGDSKNSRGNKLCRSGEVEVLTVGPDPAERASKAQSGPA